ncbi:hypothetical protein [Leptospira sp. GIMC2001]|uniref:hypothetical protein n=1 Tax=Leptospira sp. GIMC2001 TaxID=1513297 RepID=UPI00234BE8AD|nr:hypothetical protein [Leptospira sp. GIMC2001]WCL49866.1 hypothetical protein O4O04_03345 [Leptospira sp. GIMC2001]
MSTIYKLFILSSFFILLSSTLSAQVMNEFTAAEAFYTFKSTSDPEPTQMLRQNIKSALKNALIRHVPDGKRLSKDLSDDSYNFEQILESKIVIAKFQDYYFEFRYSANPSKYHMTPISQRFYKKPSGWESPSQALNAEPSKGSSTPQ